MLLNQLSYSFWETRDWFSDSKYPPIFHGVNMQTSIARSTFFLFWKYRNAFNARMRLKARLPTTRETDV